MRDLTEHPLLFLLDRHFGIVLHVVDHAGLIWIYAVFAVVCIKLFMNRVQV